MSLLSDIKSDLKQAMLEKNLLVRDTIRMFLSEIQRYEIDTKETADDAKALQIINKMIKQRNDSIEQFKKVAEMILFQKNNLKLMFLLNISLLS